MHLFTVHRIPIETDVGVKLHCTAVQADINCGTVGPAVRGQASVVRPKALESKIKGLQI